MEKTNASILIVEDEPLIRKVYREYLSKLGYNVFEAENGKEGLKVALREHPDVILLDILMPIMDGIEMLHHLRKDSWGKDARVMALTNLSREEHEMITAEHGVFDYFVKTDSSLEDVHDRIKQMLKR